MRAYVTGLKLQSGNYHFTSEAKIPRKLLCAVVTQAITTKETNNFMATTNGATGAGNIGKVVQIIGPVVDVEFSDSNLPPIYQALRVTSEGVRAVSLLYRTPLYEVIGRDTYDAVYTEGDEVLVDLPREIAARISAMVDHTLLNGGS